MSSHDSLAAIRRILIAMDASTTDAAALEATVALASRMEAELLGIFIKDINLLRFAALPFAREVGYPSAQTRRLGSAEMERSLQAQAARAEATLLAAANRWRVRCSFRTVIGEITTQLLAAAQDVDVISIGLTHRRAWRGGLSVREIINAASGSLLFLAPGAQVQPPVMVVHDGSAVAARALAVAQRLAQMDDGNLIIVTLGTAEHIRQETSERLAGSGVAAHYRAVSDMDIASLARMAHAEAVGTLVLGADIRLKSGTAQDLLEQLDCAVFLVR